MSTDVFGYGGFREWPAGRARGMELDSVPVVFGIGMARCSTETQRRVLSGRMCAPTTSGGHITRTSRSSRMIAE